MLLMQNCELNPAESEDKEVLHLQNFGKHTPFTMSHRYVL